MITETLNATVQAGFQVFSTGVVHLTCHLA
jgi:hypothetical protein